MNFRYTLIITLSSRVDQVARNGSTWARNGSKINLYWKQQWWKVVLAEETRFSLDGADGRTKVWQRKKSFVKKHASGKKQNQLLRQKKISARCWEIYV